MSGSTSVSSTSNTLASLTGTAPTTQVGAGANDSDMNEFLQLLTAQLQNQDPTNPTDPTQFVSQLAQFSTVEQLTQSNTTLDTIQQSLSGMALGQYSGMINQPVVSNASQITIASPGSISAPIGYTLSSGAVSNATIQVTNAAGTVVDQIPVSGSSGTVTFTGLDSGGKALPAGQYDLSLVAPGTSGTSASAGTLSMSSQVTGVAQGTSNNWLLQLQNGISVDPSTLTSLN